MGLGTGAVRLLLELHLRGILVGLESVAEIGAQDMYMNLQDLLRLTSAAGLSIDEAPFALLAQHVRGGSTPTCSARHFYELFGINTYVCFDVVDHHSAIQADLNYPLKDESLYGQFDMVTDHGSAEHVFNIAEVYRTMHRLCRPGGLIVVTQAVAQGNGFFTFDHAFFETMAAANGYSVLFSSYIVALNKTLPNGSTSEWHIPLDPDLLSALDHGKLLDISIGYVMRKESDRDFEYPYQGELLARRKAIRGYELQYLPVPPSRSYVPSHSDAQVSAGDIMRFMRRAPRGAYRRLTRRLQRNKDAVEDVLG